MKRLHKWLKTVMKRVNTFNLIVDSFFSYILPVSVPKIIHCTLQKKQFQLLATILNLFTQFSPLDTYCLTIANGSKCIHCIVHMRTLYCTHLYNEKNYILDLHIYVRMCVYMCTYSQLKTQYNDNVTVHGCTYTAMLQECAVCLCTYGMRVLISTEHMVHIYIHVHIHVCSSVYTNVCTYMWVVLRILYNMYSMYGIRTYILTLHAYICGEQMCLSG